MKEPPNTPELGGTVKRRGRSDGRLGVFTELNIDVGRPFDKWASVQWHDGGGPRICHLFELEAVT